MLRNSIANPTWPKRTFLRLLVVILISGGTAAQSTADFDSDGAIGFNDFLLFAVAFGGSDRLFDLDGSGRVDFPDFLLFSEAFRTANPAPEPSPDEPIIPVVEVDGPVLIGSSQEFSDFLATVTRDSFVVTGALRIKGTELADLTDLAGLHAVGGDLTVEGNDFLKSLSGLEGVKHIGDDLQIVRNTSLVDLTGLESLREVSGDVVITGNVSLLDVRQLSGLGAVGGLISIRDNPLLASLIGFSGVATVGGSVLIERNGSITTLAGFEKLLSVGQILSIRDNASLETLLGINQLSSAQGIVITGNASLLPIEADFLLDQMVARGFSGLKTIENNNFSSDLTIVPGSFLVTTIEELEELRSLGGDRFLIDGNLTVRGPTIVHMEPLLTLVEVTGAVEIDRNPKLINLDGLFSLRTVGKSLGVRGNSALRSLTGLNRVRTVKENLIIFRNRQLESLNALRRLQVVGESIEIRQNSVLPDSAITAFRDTMVSRGFGGDFLSIENGR